MRNILKTLLKLQLREVSSLKPVKHIRNSLQTHRAALITRVSWAPDASWAALQDHTMLLSTITVVHNNVCVCVCVCVCDVFEWWSP